MPPTRRTFPPLPTEPSPKPAEEPDPPAPPPRRTLFAVTLQIGRSRASLLALVRGIAHGMGAGMPEAAHIARAILCGARDRSRDPYPRSVNDAQCRTKPLTRMRLRPRRKGAKRRSPHAAVGKEPM